MDCSTIIVSYNTFDLTREAVRSALEAAPELEHEVIIVDNASPDESGRRLRTAFPSEDYPRVRVVQNKNNVGFSRANNQGAALASGRVFFFLNPDTIVHDDAIARLYHFALTHKHAGALGPRVLNPDGTDQPSTARFITPWEVVKRHLPLSAALRGLDHRDDPIPLQTCSVDVVKGCALALRRDAFETVGGWDESYFMYSEEVELCRDLVETGYTNYYVRDAVITHYWGASTEARHAEQQVIQHRSELEYLRRHYSTWTRLLYRVTGAAGFGARAAVFNSLAVFRAENAESYKKRGRAAGKLFRWFLLDFS